MESGKVGPKSEYGMNTELFFFEYEQIPNSTIWSQLFEYQIIRIIRSNSGSCSIKKQDYLFCSFVSQTRQKVS